jgi:hypothetical protein
VIARGVTSGVRPAWIAAVLLASVCAAAAEGTGFVWRVALEKALPVQHIRSDRWPVNQSELHDLELDLTFDGARWDSAVWGFYKAFPGLEHPGRLMKVEEKGAETRFEIEVEVLPNRSRPIFIGGTGRYAIAMRRGQAGTTVWFTGVLEPLTDEERLSELERTWGYGFDPNVQNERDQRMLKNIVEGRLPATNVAGNAVVSIRPLRMAASRLRLPQPGEHPRLWLRKADVDALRAFGKTDEGKKLVKRVQARYASPVWGEHHYAWSPMLGAAEGFLYQLTGDPEHARRAASLCSAGLHFQLMTACYHFPAYTLMGMGLGYDFCYDAWDPEFRVQVYSYLESHVRQQAQRHDQPDVIGTAERFTFKPDRSDYRYNPDHGDIRNDRFGAGIAALAILNDPPPVYVPPAPETVRDIEPMDAADVAPGVPIRDYESDVMPREWLINGPFPRPTMPEIRRQVGDVGKLRPKPGDPIQVEGVTVHWRFYRPANVDGSRPMVYTRDCGRYMGRGTGGGYHPGMHVAARWSGKTGERSPAMNVLLYTVIRNDRTRTVQALPNWRSVSIGNRMWIGGVEVRDGDLIRLKPGLYPFGGYSSQELKLRDFTPQLRREAELLGGRSKVLTGPGIESNRVLLDALSMARSAERFLDTYVDADGFYDDYYATDVLQPFLLALKRVLGVNLAAESGLQNLPLAAARLRGVPPSFRCDRMVLLTYDLLTEANRPPAEAYLRQFGREHRFVIDPIVDHLFLPRSFDSAGSAWRAGGFDNPKYGMHGVWNGVSGEGKMLALVWSGRDPVTSRFSTGTFLVEAFGRRWAEWAVPYVEKDRHLNGVLMGSLIPTTPGALTLSEEMPNAAGRVVSVKAGSFVDRETGKRVAGASWLRSVGVDFSGKSGAPLLVAVGDRVAAPKGMQKSWQMDLGAIPERGNLADGAPAGPRVVWAPEGTAAKLQVVFASPEGVETRLKRHGGLDRCAMVDAALDRAGSMEAAAKMGDAADVASEEIGDLAANLPVTTFLAILTVQTNAPPAVQVQGPPAARTARIGGRTVAFDGKRIVFGE